MAEPTEEHGLSLMPLGKHLEELRRRVLVCVAALGAAFIFWWVFRLQLFAVLRRPHVMAMRALELDTTLSYRSYFEPIMAQLKACLIAALIVSAPVVIYEAWAFVAPGLFPHERRKVVKIGAACTVCFAAGVLFGYFVFLPVALRALASFAGPGTTPVLMINEYLSVLFLLTFALGVAFQTPVAVYFLVRWGVLSTESLRKHRRMVVLGAFVVGAAITPGPDPVTQIMMSATLILLYELGGLLAAPGLRALLGALRFTGPAVLVAGGVWAWLALRPVATAAARHEPVRLDGRPVQVGHSVGIRANGLCETTGPAVAEITLSHNAVLYLAGEGKLRVHRSGRVTLLAGELLASNSGTRPLEVRAAAGQATLTDARAELSVPDPDTFTVTSLAGTVTVQAAEQTYHLQPGRTLTLRRGGLPADTSEAEARWRQRLAD